MASKMTTDNQVLFDLHEPSFPSRHAELLELRKMQTKNQEKISQLQQELEKKKKELDSATRGENLQGVTIAMEKIFTFMGNAAQDQELEQNTAQYQEWEQYGFHVRISPRAFISDQVHEVAVKALVAGKFKFPPDCMLVSAVYAMEFSDKLHSIEVKLQHCVDIKKQKQSQRLSFVRADLNQPPPYTFRTLDNGTFDANSAYGSVSCENFSLLAVVYTVKRRLFSPSVSKKVRWTAKLVHHKEAEKWMFTFVFSKNLDVLNQYATTKLKGTEEWAKLNFSFKEECVTLDLEKEKIVNGWKLINRQHPCQLHWKDVVQTDDPESSVHFFCMDVFPLDDAANDLEYEVPLTGTVEDNLSFFIHLYKREASVTQALPAPDSATDATTLSIEQLDDVKQELPNFDEWKKLGSSLGLTVGRLDVIKRDYEGVEECLVEVLKDWLQGDYDKIKYGSPTWDCLVNALYPINHALAMRIKEKHC